MSEPQRLKDKYEGGFEGALLRSARADAPSAPARGRAFVALGVGSAVAGVPAATTAAASAAGAKTVASVGLLAAVKWGGVGLAVGALTVGGIRQAPKLFHGGVEARAVATTGAKSSSPIARSYDTTPTVEPEASLPPGVEPPSVEPSAPSPSPVAPAAPAALAAPARAAAPLEPSRSAQAGSNAAPPLDESHLADEVAVLDRARRASATDPVRALGLLDEYDARFPRGSRRRTRARRNPRELVPGGPPAKPAREADPHHSRMGRGCAMTARIDFGISERRRGHCTGRRS
jgi:hypothetical protein